MSCAAGADADEAAAAAAARLPVGGTPAQPALEAEATPTLVELALGVLNEPGAALRLAARTKTGLARPRPPPRCHEVRRPARAAAPASRSPTKPRPAPRRRRPLGQGRPHRSRRGALALRRRPRRRAASSWHPSRQRGWRARALRIRIAAAAAARPPRARRRRRPDHLRSHQGAAPRKPRRRAAQPRARRELGHGPRVGRRRAVGDRSRSGRLPASRFLLGFRGSRRGAPGVGANSRPRPFARWRRGAPVASPPRWRMQRQNGPL